MPKIAIYKYFTFFVYSFDILNEQAHLHIVKEKGNRQRSAKVWLQSLEISEKGSLTEKELNVVLKLISENKKALLNSIEKIKNGKKVSTLKLQ